MRIEPVEQAEQLETIRELFREYADGLGIDLCFQGFDAELRDLPGRYAPPDGCLLLARAEDKVVGCAALRPLERSICEMKRLYVRPAFRRAGAGALLTDAAIAFARRRGYGRMRLDTLAGMAAARALYRSRGFVEISPYYENPIPGAVYLELSLTGQGKDTQ